MSAGTREQSSAQRPCGKPSHFGSHCRAPSVLSCQPTSTNALSLDHSLGLCVAVRVLFTKGIWMHMWRVSKMAAGSPGNASVLGQSMAEINIFISTQLDSGCLKGSSMWNGKPARVVASCGKAPLKAALFSQECEPRSGTGRRGIHWWWLSVLRKEKHPAWIEV